jgi:ecdysteroid 25-hydroxylase CYP302A1
LSLHLVYVSRSFYASLLDLIILDSNQSSGPWINRESLRLNPVSVGVGRILPQDTLLGGYWVPKGTVCVTQNQVLYPQIPVLDNEESIMKLLTIDL